MGTQKQSGTSMVEVMVALFVLAIGLLGMLAMQTKSMQYNQAAYTYAQAAYLANDMVERIRTNRVGIADYTGTPSDAGNCDNQYCAPAVLAAWDLDDVNTKVADHLPGGALAVVQIPNIVSGANFLRVTVSFKNDRTNDVDPGNNQAVPDGEYSLMVEI